MSPFDIGMRHAVSFIPRGYDRFWQLSLLPLRLSDGYRSLSCCIRRSRGEMAEREYRPLVRNFLRRFVSRYSVWLGRDHLLSVESKGFHERYRRFYFRDIQFFAIRGTSRRATINWILAGSLLLLLLLTIASFRSGERFL